MVGCTAGGYEMDNNNILNEDFSLSLFTPWIKGNIKLDENLLRVDNRNTIIGIFPAGKTKDSTPINNISNVSTSLSFKVFRILFGAWIALSGFVNMWQSLIFGLIFAAIGMVLIANGIVVVFSYERSGIQKKVELPFFESERADEWRAIIEQKMVQYQEERNDFKQTNRIVDAVSHE